MLLVCDRRRPQTGPKAAIDPDRIPPRFARWATVEDLTRARPVDALLVPAALGIDFATLPPARVRAALQTSWSDLVDLDPARWDRIYAWTETWTEFWAARRPRQPVPANRFVPVGHPLADHLTWLDPEEIRKAYRLPSGQIVLFYPFPFGAHAQSWRLKVGYRWLGHRRLTQALRAYCDRVGAALVVSHRAKVDLPGYVQRAADVFVEGESDEATGLRLLRVSSLFVHHLSSGAAEAAAANVRALCVIPEDWDAYDSRGRDFNPDPDQGFTFWQWPGVSLAYRPANVGTILSMMPCTELEGRADYLARYVGPEPFQAGEKILADLEARLA